MAKRLIRPVLLVVIPILVTLAAGYYWLQGGRFVTTDNAYVKTHIAHVSSEQDGRVDVILIDDHAHVKAGDILIELDRAPFEVAVAKARAEVDAARQEVKTLIATLREAETELAEWSGQQAYLDAQLKRQRKLARRGIVASTKLEDAAEAARRGRDRSQVAKQKVARMLAQIGGDPKRPVDLHPRVREKLAALDAAKLDLKRTRIVAPIDGQVVNLRLQPGEQIEAAKALLAIVAESAPWVEANFKETELTHVRAGMFAEVTLDIYPDVTWRASVASISPATGAEFALLPPQNASGNWVKVVQRLPVILKLEPSNGRMPKLRAGMTAGVSVDTKRQRTLASLFGSWAAIAGTRPAGATDPYAADTNSVGNASDVSTATAQ
ncbi:MAG: HlyD family secretion protein [Pseudomonadota bacterium]